jgi:stage II sporulation protein D
VNATKGMVLVRRDGRLVDTVYSASCGGHTEHNDNAWPVHADPNLRGHLDGESNHLRPFRQGINERNLEAWLTQRPQAWCNHPRYNRDKFRWVTRLPAARANKLVGQLGIGELREIRVASRGVSGRATLLELEGSRGTTQVRGELTIRRLLGGLRSSMFIVKTVTTGDGRPTEFVFHGGGWGHGVGMCQTGAIGMAEAGRRHEQILQHYYPASELQPLY